VDSCAECGFSHEALATADVAGAVRGLVDPYRAALGHVDPGLAARRPQPAVWSALEYACHVRDLLLVQRERVVLAQVEEQPRLAPMSRDDRVAICRYDAEPPSVVLDQLAMAADLLALVLDSLDGAGWARRLHYNFPVPEIRSVEWVGRHTVHEMTHHLADIGRVLGSVGAAG
jgi:DNA segregation ATPase FtsK/SpoIIIE, S-DNA-T family